MGERRTKQDRSELIRDRANPLIESETNLRLACFWSSLGWTAGEKVTDRLHIASPDRDWEDALRWSPVCLH